MADDWIAGIYAAMGLWVARALLAPLATGSIRENERHSENRKRQARRAARRAARSHSGQRLRRAQSHAAARCSSARPKASLVMAAENLLIARVPEGAAGGAVRVRMGSVESAPFPMALGMQIADNLHPVANPAVDADGNVYVTFSGQRGQKVPVSLYKMTANQMVKPFITELMNPTGLALDRDGNLFVSCRKTAPSTAFRPMAARCSGSKAWASPRASRLTRTAIFMWATAVERFSKSARTGKFSCLPRSSLRCPRTIWLSAPTGDLFVTGPTTSSFDRVYKISPAGEVSALSTAGLDGRRDSRLTASAISTWLGHSAASAGSCASLHRRKPKSS